MLDNQLLKTQLSRIDEELRSLRAKNKLLIESQKLFEQKLRKLSVSRVKTQRFPGNLSHNRNKSENNANFLCVNAGNVASLNKFSTDSLAFSNNNEQLSTDELFYREIEPLDTRNCRKIVNLSLIDSEDCRNEEFSERKQYIRFLQNMGVSLNNLLRNSGKSFKRKEGRCYRSVSLNNIGKNYKNYLMKIENNEENFNNNNMNNINIYNNNNNSIRNGFFSDNNNNKYFSLRNDLKEVVNKYFGSKSQSNLNIPNPRMERNLISPISKPNDQENFSSTFRQQLHNHTMSLPFGIGNLGNEEVFL